MACEVKRVQEKQAVREILSEQIEMDKLRKKVDKEDIKEPTKTHFGPQEDNQVSKALMNRKREMTNVVHSDLKRQMA